MRIHCLRTGVVRGKRGERGVRRYVREEWRDDALPVNAFLVEHPSGLCLFDTGQTSQAAQRGYFPWWQPYFRLARFELGPEDEAARQLGRLGYSPADVRWVVLSHLHTDHAGGIEPFADSEVVISRTEWQSARGFAGQVRGYLPQHWPVGLAPKLVDFDGASVGPFPASYDVAGDGRLRLVPTPGHTRGHAALLVCDDAAGFLLGGDLVHTAAQLPASAPEIANFCAREGLVFLAAHDEVAETLIAAG